MEHLIETISSAVDQREEELIDLLGKLVAFPTKSPPARNTNEIQAFIKKYLDDLSHAINEKLEIQQSLNFTNTLAVFIANWSNKRKDD